MLCDSFLLCKGVNTKMVPEQEKEKLYQWQSWGSGRSTMPLPKQGSPHRLKMASNLSNSKEISLSRKPLVSCSFAVARLCICRLAWHKPRKDFQERTRGSKRERRLKVGRLTRARRDFCAGIYSAATSRHYSSLLLQLLTKTSRPK